MRKSMIFKHRLYREETEEKVNVQDLFECILLYHICDDESQISNIYARL